MFQNKYVRFFTFLIVNFLALGLGVLLMKNGPLAGLCSRAVVVIDETGKVIYTEQVSEIADEPDYEKALSALS